MTIQIKHLASLQAARYTCFMTYQTINTQPQLTEFCQQLEHQAWFVIDTEFVRKDTYYPELSLIQVCSEQGELALIDPLAIADMQVFWQLLANPKVAKVFHSARQDIEVLFQVGGLMPQAIFDTQIACVFLGHGDLAGLARVIEAEFGHTLDKAQTRTNWHQRPLSEQQIQYALDDVRYLAPLYKKLLGTLTPTQLNALEWDFNQLLNPELYHIPPDQAWCRIKGTQALSPKQIGIVHRLAAWREQTAINANLPRKWVVPDEAIITLAKRPVRAVEGLYKIKELNAGLVRQYGEAIIQQLDLAFAHPENWPDKPVKPTPATPEEEPIIQAALAYAQQQAVEYGLNLPNLLQKRDVLELLRSQSGPLTQGWRAEVVGKKLSAFFNHQACLNVENGHLHLT